MSAIPRGPTPAKSPNPRWAAPRWAGGRGGWRSSDSLSLESPVREHSRVAHRCICEQQKIAKNQPKVLFKKKSQCLCRRWDMHHRPQMPKIARHGTGPWSLLRTGERERERARERERKRTSLLGLVWERDKERKRERTNSLGLVCVCIYGYEWETKKERESKRVY